MLLDDLARHILAIISLNCAGKKILQVKNPNRVCTYLLFAARLMVEISSPASAAMVFIPSGTRKDGPSAKKHTGAS